MLMGPCSAPSGCVKNPCCVGTREMRSPQRYKNFTTNDHHSPHSDAATRFAAKPAAQRSIWFVACPRHYDQPTMIELVVAGVVGYLVYSGQLQSAGQAARMAGRLLGRAAGSIRRTRAQLSRMSAAAGSHSAELQQSTAELRQRMWQLQSVRAEAASLANLQPRALASSFLNGGMHGVTAGGGEFTPEEVAAAMQGADGGGLHATGGMTHAGSATAAPVAAAWPPRAMAPTLPSAPAWAGGPGMLPPMMPPMPVLPAPGAPTAPAPPASSPLYTPSYSPPAEGGGGGAWAAAPYGISSRGDSLQAPSAGAHRPGGGGSDIIMMALASELEAAAAAAAAAAARGAAGGSAPVAGSARGAVGGSAAGSLPSRPHATMQ